MIEIVAIDTPSLGDRTYLATDGVSALVVDPQRDIDRVLAAAATYPVSDYRDLAAACRDRPVTVVDVRRRTEREARHIDGSLPIPLHELPGRLPELPDGPVWVHCQGGYRASIAASLLQAAGYAVTAVDDDFSRAAAAGLAITGRSGPAPAAVAPPRLRRPRAS